MRSQKHLCHLADLPDGGARGFDPHGAGRDTCFLVRQGKVVYSYLNSCPHVDGSPLAWRKDEYLDAAQENIVCHGHGALFDIPTGVCTLGPCVGERLQSVENSIDPNGQVCLHFNHLETT
jgi:nitrite reductase/ring-hydroxylating ferredoxin subunit